MLIYNFQKEFIGIDEDDLNVFGFANLAELKAESTDFADMFVRTPGYIHNFKHVHWIDFVTCADPSEESKVIIEVNAKTYKATIKIDTIYLSDNPTSKAYLINLHNLRGLTLKENGEVSEDVARKRPPRVEPDVGFAFNTPQEEPDVESEEALASKAFEAPQIIEETPKNEEFKMFEEPEEVQETLSRAPLDISFDDDVDSSIFESKDEYEPEIAQPAISETPEVEINDPFSIDSLELESFESEENVQEKQEVQETSQTEEDDGYDYSYNYDPQVASDELGLPIDLIEEFIQDFIAQAKEFKDELHSSLNDGDLDNVKILSHKLKGVAANLRIEDAFNTLSIVNTSSDISEVEKYLHIFYKTIAKLSGEEIETSKPAIESKPEAVPSDVTPVPNEEQVSEVEEETDLYEDDLVIDFKEDTVEEIEIKEDVSDEEKDTDDDLYLDLDLDIKDSEVPQKIEMPELADDEFLNDEIKVQETEEDIDDILLLEDEVSIEIDETEDLTLEEEEEVVTGSVIEEEEVFDINYSKDIVANEIGLDKESFDEIFEDYINDSQLSISTMTEAISQNDLTQCKKEAMKLKGMSDNMRVNAFKDELITIINSSDKDELSSAIKKISAIIAQISK